MSCRSRKESWPPRAEQQPVHGAREPSLQPAGVAPEYYFSRHPSWHEGAQPDRIRRTQRMR